MAIVKYLVYHASTIRVETETKTMNAISVFAIWILSRLLTVGGNENKSNSISVIYAFGQFIADEVYI
jgi:hypothetical protein